MTFPTGSPCIVLIPTSSGYKDKSITEPISKATSPLQGQSPTEALSMEKASVGEWVAALRRLGYSVTELPPGCS
jgi:hypothetical protein